MIECCERQCKLRGTKEKKSEESLIVCTEKATRTFLNGDSSFLLFLCSSFWVSFHLFFFLWFPNFLLLYFVFRLQLRYRIGEQPSPLCYLIEIMILCWREKTLCICRSVCLYPLACFVKMYFFSRFFRGGCRSFLSCLLRLVRDC